MKKIQYSKMEEIIAGTGGTSCYLVGIGIALFPLITHTFLISPAINCWNS